MYPKMWGYNWTKTQLPQFYSGMSCTGGFNFKVPNRRGKQNTYKKNHIKIIIPINFRVFIINIVFLRSQYLKKYTLLHKYWVYP
jgi:hypothetical protein